MINLCCVKSVQFCNLWNWGLLCQYTWGSKTQWLIFITMILKPVKYIVLALLKFSYQYLDYFCNYSKHCIGDVTSVKCITFMFHTAFMATGYNSWLSHVRPCLIHDRIRSENLSSPATRITSFSLYCFHSSRWKQMSLVMRKRVFGSFRPGQTQIGLLSYRS